MTSIGNSSTFIACAKPCTPTNAVTCVKTCLTGGGEYTTLNACV